MKRREILARTIRQRLRHGRPLVHMLHIGKTGGTALKARLCALNEDPDCRVRFFLHDHGVRLRHLPPGARYFFAVRDPVARFVSGFYSRKRQGQPRYFYPWSPDEKAAFDRFAEAHDLAEALADPGDAGARAAMEAIQHVNAAHLDWFDGDPALPLKRRRPVAILRQTHLDADFARMLTALGVTCPRTEAALPARTEAAHRNDYSRVPPLSEPGRTALERWYADDIAFVADAARHAAEPD